MCNSFNKLLNQGEIDTNGSKMFTPKKGTVAPEDTR